MTTYPEQDESINKASWELPAGVYGHAVSGSHGDSDDSPESDEATVRDSLLVKSYKKLYIY